MKPFLKKRAHQLKFPQAKASVGVDFPVLPTHRAATYSLDGAAVVEFFHSGLLRALRRKARRQRKGRIWVPYTEMKRQQCFCFWDPWVLYTTLDFLKKHGFISVMSKRGTSRKFYTINYKRLHRFSSFSKQGGRHASPRA